MNFGDSLLGIANKFHVNFNDLNINSLIKAGDMFKLPK